MKIERDEQGALRINADGIEVVVQDEDDAPCVTQTLSADATRAAVNEVEKALAAPSRWPTRKIACI